MGEKGDTPPLRDHTPPLRDHTPGEWRKGGDGVRMGELEDEHEPPATYGDAPTAFSDHGDEPAASKGHVPAAAFAELIELVAELQRGCGGDAPSPSSAAVGE